MSYRIDAKLEKRWKTVANGHESLYDATTQARREARVHKRDYRVRDELGKVILVAHPDGSWRGKLDVDPEAPI